MPFPVQSEWLSDIRRCRSIHSIGIKIGVDFRVSAVFLFAIAIESSMLYHSLQRFPSTFKSAISSGPCLLRPIYSKRMSSAVPQQVVPASPRPDALYRSLALPLSEDDSGIRQKYRPFILSDNATEDWINNLELTTALEMAELNLRETNKRLKVLVLYGSLRRRSYSRLVALEASRILFRLGCDVRVFNPEGLPVKNDNDTDHPKVQELRELSCWSDGHIWVSPEQHGNLVSCLSLTLILTAGAY